MGNGFAANLVLVICNPPRGWARLERVNWFLARSDRKLEDRP
jgi:hypothetical protein